MFLQTGGYCGKPRNLLCMKHGITSYCKDSEAVRVAQPSLSLWGFPFGNISRSKHKLDWTRISLMNSLRRQAMVAINYYTVMNDIPIHGEHCWKHEVTTHRLVPAMVSGTCFLFWSFLSPSPLFPFPSSFSFFILWDLPFLYRVVITCGGGRLGWLPVSSENAIEDSS